MSMRLFTKENGKVFINGTGTEAISITPVKKSAGTGFKLFFSRFRKNQPLAMERVAEYMIFKLLKGVDKKTQGEYVKKLSTGRFLSEEQSCGLLMSKKVTEGAAQIPLLKEIKHPAYALKIAESVELDLDSVLSSYHECAGIRKAVEDIVALVRLADAKSPNKDLLLNALTLIQKKLESEDVPNALRVMDYCGELEKYKFEKVFEMRFHYDGRELDDFVGMLFMNLLEKVKYGEIGRKEKVGHMKDVLSALHAHPSLQHYAAGLLFSPPDYNAETAEENMNILNEMHAVLAAGAKEELARHVSEIAGKCALDQLEKIQALLTFSQIKASDIGPQASKWLKDAAGTIRKRTSDVPVENE